MIKNSNYIRIGKYIINLSQVTYIKIEKDFTTIFFCSLDGNEIDTYPHCIVFRANQPECQALLNWFDHFHVVPNLLELGSNSLD